MRSTLRVLLIILICSLLLTACVEREGYLELGLELPRPYYELEVEDTFDAAYTDGYAVVGLVRLSFEAAIDDGIIETYSPEALAKYYRKRIGKDTAELLTVGEVPYIVYTDTDGETAEEYTYLAAFYRTRYAYFILTCLVPSKSYSHYTEEFLVIAGSAYIDYKRPVR